MRLIVYPHGLDGELALDKNGTADIALVDTQDSCKLDLGHVALLHQERQHPLR